MVSLLLLHSVEFLLFVLFVDGIYPHMKMFSILRRKVAKEKKMKRIWSQIGSGSEKDGKLLSVP